MALAWVQNFDGPGGQAIHKNSIWMDIFSQSQSAVAKCTRQEYKCEQKWLSGPIIALAIALTIEVGKKQIQYTYFCARYPGDR